VEPLELPGRGARFRERSRSTLADLLADLVPVVGRRIRGRFALFGHSMGALVAFEIARRLREQGVLASYVFASAYPAPHLSRRPPPFHAWPRGRSRRPPRHDGAPAQIAACSPELLDLMLPILRADYAVCEGYRYRAEPSLACPILACGGETDVFVDLFELGQW